MNWWGQVNILQNDSMTKYNLFNLDFDFFLFLSLPRDPDLERERDFESLLDLSSFVSPHKSYLPCIEKMINILTEKTKIAKRFMVESMDLITFVTCKTK